MARPLDPSAPYRISIHNIGGYRYASTQPTFRDPETGKTKHKRIHWGTVDESNKFIPGSKYIFATIEERSKLIFPEDWDMSELERLSGGRKRGRPVIESQDENRLYGDIWLMEQIAEVTGIREDLMKVFDENKEMVNAILTLAYFPMSGRGTYDHLAAWMRIAKAPYEGDLSSPSINTLRSLLRSRTEWICSCVGKSGLETMSYVPLILPADLHGAAACQTFITGRAKTGCHFRRRWKS